MTILKKKLLNLFETAKYECKKVDLSSPFFCKILLAMAMLVCYEEM